MTDGRRADRAVAPSAPAGAADGTPASAKTGVNRLKPGLGPSEGLTWRRVDDFFIRSACGRWQICRTGERGSCHERFSLWRRSPESGATQLIAVQRSADEARAIAAKEQAGTLEH